MAFDANESVAQAGTIAPPPGGKNPQTGTNEKALISKLEARLKQGRDSMGTYKEKVKTLRKYVQGKQHDDGEGGLVRANIIQSHLKRSLNRVYARNPEFSIRPTESVTPSNYKKWGLFGRTAEIVLNRYMDDAGLKRVAKAVVRSAKTVKVGWMKVYYQTLTEASPIYGKNFQDTEEKLQRLRYLNAKVNDETGGRHEAEIAELELYQKGLDAEKQSIVSEGLVAEHIQSENIILDLSTINSLDDYWKAPYIAEEVWATAEEVETQFNKKPVGATLYQAQNVALARREGSNAGLVKLTYFWDRRNLQVYTMVDGMDGFIAPPIHPAVTSEQWYPFYPLGLNPVDGDFWHLSDTELLMELQDEHNTARTSFRDHREKSRPHWVASVQAWGDKNDLKGFLNAESMEVTLLNVPQGENVLSGIAVVPTPPIDPRVYDTAHIAEDTNRVVDGGEGATQPTSNTSRTLGEAELLNTEVAAQSSGDTDEIEDWFRSVAKGTLEILLQVLTQERVYAIAGDPAYTDEQGKFIEGSMWPDSSISDIYDMVNVEIRAGSSGRPNKRLEMQSLTEFMPQMVEMLRSIAELEAAGQMGLSKAMRKMAQEAIRRFDERLDVEDFLPEAEEGEQGGDQPQEPAPDPALVAQQQEAQRQQEMDAAKMDFEQQKAQGDMDFQIQKLEMEMDFNREKLHAELDMKRRIEAAKLNDPDLLSDPNTKTKSEEDMDKLAESIAMLSQTLAQSQAQTSQQMAAFAQGMSAVLQTINAPRQINLIRDSNGRAQGAESVVAGGVN